MLTKNFLDLLENNPEKDLIFEYHQNRLVPKSYHITEVKNLHIESVDCGGRPDTYYQTVTQLWVNPTEKVDNYLSTTKALKIFQKVDQIKPIRLDTELFFEWGHGQLPTSNYAVESIENEEGHIRVKLTVPATVCKPRYEMEVLGKKVSCC